jgi:hypothetical protein
MKWGFAPSNAKEIGHWRCSDAVGMFIAVSGTPHTDSGLSQTNTIGDEAGVSQQGRMAGHRTQPLPRPAEQRRGPAAHILSFWSSPSAMRRVWCGAPVAHDL